jgi:hypothetical protein
MSDDDRKKKTGSRAIAAFEQSGAFRVISIGEDLRKAQEATGIGSIQRALDSSGYSAVGRMLEQTRTMQLDSGIGATIRAMTERNTIFADQLRSTLALQTSPFTAMLEKYRAPALGIQRAVEAYKMSLPTNGIQIGSALNGLDFIRIGQTFERFNLDGIIGSEFSTISRRMAEQIKTLQIVKAPKLDFALSANIGDLLARSVEAQEALLEVQNEYVDSKPEAENAAITEARFHRRMAYFNTLIAVLSLFLMIAISWEEVLEVSGVPKAEPIETTQMREAFLEMSVQLDDLRRVEEERVDREDAEALREAEADAEIAAVLREIANTLKDDDENADPAP